MRPTPSPQTPQDCRLAGEQRRKKFPRAALAHWSSNDRKHDPLKLIVKSLHDRVEALSPLKYKRMCASPFGFFRGAAPVMAYDLSLSKNTGISAQLCGDAHVQNLGAYTGPDGRLIFDINDFDETIRGPFEWDLKRMATSILLTGDYAHLKQSACNTAAEMFLSSYAGLMQQLSRMPILAVARFQVHRLGGVAPIFKILRKAEHETPMHSLERLTEDTAHGRIFKTSPPLLKRLTGPDASAVLASLKPYTHSLLPERQHFLSQYRPIDVAFKVVGTGSIGLRDYCVLLQGNGTRDPLFLQIKQEAPSVYAEYLPKSQVENENNGKRTADGQRAMQLQSDPLLGWTRLGGRDYLVRQLNDHKASVDIATLKASDLAEYAAVCGELLARGHARSGDARTIAGYIGNGARFKSAMLDFAQSYAAQTATDWKALVKSRA